MAPNSTPSASLTELLGALRALPTVTDPMLHRDDEWAGEAPALPILQLLAEARDRLTAGRGPTRAA
ncbi:MAG: hypothetical protein AB7G17_03255 [Phycisphaerales bacterium]